MFAAYNNVQIIAHGSYRLQK